MSYFVTINGVEYLAETSPAIDHLGREFERLESLAIGGKYIWKRG